MLFYKKIILMTFVILGVTVATAQNNSDEKGVVINGVKWATRNVGAPGTFVSSPENYGEFYTWKEAQKVCPAGWRLPTQIEIESLVDIGSVQTAINDVNGGVFGSGNNVIFLPAAGTGDLSTNDLSKGQGHSGLYWSGTVSTRKSAHILLFTSTMKDSDVPIGLTRDRSGIHSVRCVAE